MRNLMLTCWLAAIFTGISFLFWHNEWKYSLPTKIPSGYHAVERGTLICLPEPIIRKDPRPSFIHFFNPDCPCSRFNINHFKSLVKKYGDALNFSVVVMSKHTNYTAKEIQDKFDLAIPVSFDQSIAKSCGVYSTPQAVILNTDNSLYYRGNYNKGRYCIDKNSNYAQMAIDSILAHRFNPIFDQAAFKSYGCQLPSCTK